MKPYEIKHLIVDKHFMGEESVTADFTYNHKHYSATFSKEDYELQNAWVHEEESSVPANLSDQVIDSLREDVKNQS